MAGGPGFEIPKKILDVMRLFRHKRLGKGIGKALNGPAASIHEGSVENVLRGIRDKEKQSALYVNLLDTGAVETTPETAITISQAEEADKIAWNFIFFLSEIISTGTSANYFYTKVVWDLQKMFSDPQKINEFNNIIRCGVEGKR